MLSAIETGFAGFLLRTVQVVVESSLYLLIGLLTAGALRAMAGPGRLRRLFGAGPWTGPVRAWAAATALLPVCALGVLPVLRELRRAGVSRPAVLTFALAAPMLNPISLVYGVSYLGPWVLAVLVLGAFFVSVGVGVAWGHLRPRDLVEEPAGDEVSVPAVGLRRVAAAEVHAAREATGPTARDVAAGVLAAGLVSALVSAPYLAASEFAGDPLAVPRMTAVAPFAYASPDRGVTIVPEMLKFRQSTGAMFVLIALGVGMTFGHLTWIARAYGVRSAALWFALALGSTLVTAYAVDALIPPVGTPNADNDHFAALANPFEGQSGLSDLLHAFRLYAEGVGAFQWFTCGALFALVLAGLVLRSLGERGRFEAFLTPPLPVEAEAPAASPWNRPLPPRLVSAVGVGVFLAVAVAGSYAYFPAPSEAFRDMQIIKADFYGELSAPSPDAPLHHLDLWDRQAAKLPTGALIRFSGPGAEARRLTEELRAGIRRLRDATGGGRRDEARVTFVKLQAAYDRCKKAYGVR